jgi:hypothetical protein
MLLMFAWPLPLLGRVLILCGIHAGPQQEWLLAELKYLSWLKNLLL